VDNPILQKIIIILILVLWVIDEFRTKKDNVLPPPLKRLMPENAMNGATSDGGSGHCKWQQRCIFLFS
jgi:hypothetical protein